MMIDPGVHIRAATHHDIARIVEMWDQMMREHEQGDPHIRLARDAGAAYRAYVGYHVTSGDSFVPVAEAPGGVVGFGLVTVGRNMPMFEPQYYGYLSDLTVEPQWRRQGIGRALVTEIAQRFKDKGAKSIAVIVPGDAGFWKRMNFRQTTRVMQAYPIDQVLKP